MAALVQTYPTETTTITMLQTRPTSATGRMPSGQQQAMPQYGSPQAPRSVYHGNATFHGYRGSSTPIQQYAFQSTPNLNQVSHNTYRGNSSPDVETNANRHRFPGQGAMAGGSRDDSAIVQGRQGAQVARPQPTVMAGQTAKNTPDRYRRGPTQSANHMRSQSATLPSTTNTANLPNTASFYNVSANARTASANRPTSFYASIPATSMDDMAIPQKSRVDTKGMRRRSMHSIESSAAFKSQPEQANKGSEKDPKSLRTVPTSPHSRSGSSESVNSSRSNHSRPSVSHQFPLSVGLSRSSNDAALPCGVGRSHNANTVDSFLVCQPQHSGIHRQPLFRYQ